MRHISWTELRKAQLEPDQSQLSGSFLLSKADECFQ